MLLWLNNRNNEIGFRFHLKSWKSWNQAVESVGSSVQGHEGGRKTNLKMQENIKVCKKSRKDQGIVGTQV